MKKPRLLTVQEKLEELGIDLVGEIMKEVNSGEMSQEDRAEILDSLSKLRATAPRPNPRLELIKAAKVSKNNGGQDDGAL